MADGSIVFDTRIDNKGAIKDLKKLRSRIKTLSEQIEIKTELKMPVAEQAKQLAAQLDAAKASLEAMKTAPSGSYTTAQIADQAETVKALQTEWNKVQSRVDSYESSIKKATAEINVLKERAGEIEENMAAAGVNTDKMAAASSRAGKGAQGFARQLKFAMSSILLYGTLFQVFSKFTEWLGKVIRANSEASAAIARLKGALLTLVQPLLSVIIPAFTALVNILSKVVVIIAELVSYIFGTTAKQSSEAAEGLYNEAEAIEGVGSAAEEATSQLAGFDEINAISTETAGGGSGAGSDTILPDFSVTEGMDSIIDRLREIADLVLMIAAGLALWKISTLLPGVLGTIAAILAGILLTLGGLLLYWNGLTDAWENGVDWFNLIEMIAGLAAAVLGLYILLGPTAAAIGLIVGGLGMLVTAFKDAMENGFTLQNTLLAIAGIIATGLGISILTGSFIPALIAGIASVLLALTVATGNGEELIQGIKDVCQGFLDFVTGIFTGDIQKALDGIGQMFTGLKEIVSSVISGIKDGMISFLDWLDEKTNGKFTTIINYIKSIVIALLGSLEEKINSFIDGAEKIFTGIIEFITGVFTADWELAWQGVKDIFGDVWNGIVALLEGAINIIIDGLNWLISQMNKISFTVPDWIPGVGGKKLGINIPSISRVSIPRLAQGAVIPANREFLAVLGDQKSGTNVEAPLETIKQALMEAMQAGGMSGTTTVVVQLDGKEVAKNTVKHVNNMTRQAGKPVLLF